MISAKNKLTYSEKRLLLFLSNFSANEPVAGETVLSRLNIGAREFRKICLSLRNKGYKICFSLCKGYYIAENKEEYLRFRNNYTGYSHTIYKATKAMDKSKLYRNEVKRLLSGKVVNTDEEI